MKGTYREQRGHCVLQASEPFSRARGGGLGRGDGEPQGASPGWGCIAGAQRGWLQGWESRVPVLHKHQRGRLLPRREAG